MISNIDFLKKIHAGGEAFIDEQGNEHPCYITILKNWENDISFDEYQRYSANDISTFYDRLFTHEEVFDEFQKVMDEGSEDAYFSINSFWKESKTTENVRHLNAFVLDFDFYKKKQFQGMKPEEFYLHIKDTLPFLPTAAINSGRGLYVIYAFDHCSKVRVPLYKAIYARFLKLFDKYGMDSKAMNVTQVIRVPGSFNTKSMSDVTIIDYNDTAYQLIDFTEILEYTQEQVKQHKENKKTKLENKNQAVLSDKPINPARKDFFLKLMEDAKKLIRIRNRSRTTTGYREYLLFIIRERATWAGYSINEAVRFAMEINDLMDDPMLDAEVEKQCKPSSRVHVTSVKKIIANLGLNDEEQHEMQILRSKRIADLRRSKRKNKHKLLNRSEAQLKILRRRQSVFSLKKQGFKNKEIADKLTINKGTVTKDLQYINEHKGEFYPGIVQVIQELTEKLSNIDFIRILTHEVHRSLSEWLSVSEKALE